jgi:LPXTG-motif cell wall-anchored protein
VGYLDENYLGDTPQMQMSLPAELADQLAGEVVPAADNIPVPEGWTRLPGGIIIKKSTLLILGLALAIFLVWYFKKKKKE